jgi:hypothetical protein
MDSSLLFGVSRQDLLLGLCTLRFLNRNADENILAEMENLIKVIFINQLMLIIPVIEST